MKKLLLVTLLLCCSRSNANDQAAYKQFRAMSRQLATRKAQLAQISQKLESAEEQLWRKEEEAGIALHEAARRGNSLRLRELITREGLERSRVSTAYPLPGPDIGKTPLHLAAENGHFEAVNVLIAAKAHIDAKDLSISPRSPLQAAQARMQKLRDAGATPERLAPYEQIIRVLIPRRSITK